MQGAATSPTMPARMLSEQSRKSCRSSTLTRRPIGRRSILKRCVSTSSTWTKVTLSADAAAKRDRGSLKIAVTGTGRTLVAIQRMIPAWAQIMNGHQRWSRKAASLPNGELLTVTATDPKEFQHVRGLGFYWPVGERLASSVAPFGDGERRVRPRAPGPYPLKSTWTIGGRFGSSVSRDRNINIRNIQSGDAATISR